MNTATLPERKSSKNSEVTFAAATNNDFCPVAGVMTIKTDRATVSYVVEESPGDFGARSFVLHKIGDDGTDPTTSFYCVRVRPDLPEITGCTRTRDKDASRLESGSVRH